jgi:3-phosphoshikimate 1-carboxyvinyltransferase
MSLTAPTASGTLPIMSLQQDIRLAPIGRASALVELPGSKSITNRAYILSALAAGKTNLHGVLYSDDTVAMTECLGKFRIAIEQSPANEAWISGSSGQLTEPDSTLFVRYSGTTIRFLTALSALCPVGSRVVLDGAQRTRERPIVDLVTALRQLGVHAETAENGCPPVVVMGGGLPGGKCTIGGSVSSQYLSALLMTSPYAAKDVTIDVEGELVSRPYIDMTIGMMAEFGVRVENDAYRTFFIPAGQKYVGQRYAIEPDASNASYFLAAAAVTQGRVTVNGIGSKSIQGDIGFVDVLENMGCEVIRGADSFTIVGPAYLQSIDFDASLIPDMAQTIAVTACFAVGTTRLTGLSTLRFKETDRIAAMATELRKLGAMVTEGEESLIIEPPALFHSAAIDTYDDHRMAMSFAIAGLRIQGITINDPGCVAKTFPDFWDRWSVAFPGSVVGEVN